MIGSGEQSTIPTEPLIPNNKNIENASTKKNKEEPFNLNTFKKYLSNVESTGTGGYKAFNEKTNALGKYQYLWKYNKDNIKKVTGISDMQSFLNNPKAQEKYHDWEVNNGYAKTHTDKLYNKLKNKFPDLSYTDFRLIAHFRPGSLDDLLKGTKTLKDRPTKNKNNKTIEQYLKTAKGK